MQGLLTGDVAVVTGAARGNGRAIAFGLAAQGAAVAAFDLDGEGAAETARRCAGLSGRDAHSAWLDVSDLEGCRAEAERVAQRLGPVSVLVNNAGILPRGGFAEITDEDWEAVLRVNVTGARNACLAFLDQLRSTGGRIVNLASILSFTGAPLVSGYAASKGAVAQLTKALAVELAPDGIRVNAIAPGVIETPMTEATRANPQALGRFMAHTPLGRVGKPDELAGPVVFLASAMSSYVTGVILPVDGGYLAA